MSDVLDLDILRPKAKRVKIGGKEIDVGFIPVAMTWEIDRLVQELAKFTEEKIANDPESQKKALLVSCEMCAAFCYQHEELTAEWFRENTSVTQIHAFVEVIKGTLMEAYAGIEEYRGNV
jgi:hypothetical protein